MRSLLSGLMDYWPLHEASGSRGSAIGQHTLTDNGTVTQSAGRVVYAGQFTAVNSEYLSAADDAALSTGDIDYTLWAWVYFDTKAADRSVISKWSAAGQLEYLLWYESGTDRLQFFVSGNGTASTSVSDSSLGSPATATWYFLRAWHDSVGNVIGIQSDVRAPVTAAHTTGSFDSTSSVLIGASTSTPANFWNGRICEVGFSKRLLTTQEHWWLYNDGLGRTYPFDGRPSPSGLGRHPAMVGPRRSRLPGVAA